MTGKGSFVASQNSELIREEHLRRAEALLSEAADTAKAAGITLEELCQVLAMLYGEE